MLNFSVLNSTFANPFLFSLLYALLLSFLLGVVLAVIYVRTFKGLSYSVNFVHGIVIFPIIIAMAMQAIGDNVARGIGMIGALSLLRFRSNIKDMRDMFFIFATLTVGLATGVHSYGIAILGTAILVAAMLVLDKSPFSSGPQFDGLLRFNLLKNSNDQREIEKFLMDMTVLFSLMSIKELAQGDRLDFTYQVRLKPGIKSTTMVDNISNLEEVRGLQFMSQESVVEI